MAIMEYTESFNGGTDALLKKVKKREDSVMDSAGNP